MSQYTSFTDLWGTELSRLVRSPLTVDKDRYARAIRSEIRKALADFDLGTHSHKKSVEVTLILTGTLRTVKHNLPVEDNRETLTTALDLISELHPEVTWRTEKPFTGAAEAPVEPLDGLDGVVEQEDC